jgi:hypothetical protein
MACSSRMSSTCQLVAEHGLATGSLEVIRGLRLARSVGSFVRSSVAGDTLRSLRYHRRCPRQHQDGISMLTRFSSVLWSHNYAPRNQCLGINYLDEEIDDNCLLKGWLQRRAKIGAAAARLVTPGPGGNGPGPGTGPEDYETTIIATMPASPTGPGIGHGTGPGPTQKEAATTLSVSLAPSTIYTVSNGVSTAIGVSYIPGPIQTQTTTTLLFSLIPSTTYTVSNGVSTAISVSCVPAPTQT